MQLELTQKKRHTIGVWDVPLALFAPKRVFQRVEDVPAYGWALVLLLTAVTVIGYANVETGLVDLAVDRQVQANIAELEKAQLDVVERSALRKMIADQVQQGEFFRLMSRIQVVAFRPIWTLIVVLIIPAMLYGLVALTGKKPEWHTLIAICVFASFASLLGSLTELLLMLQFGTLQVDTSLSLLSRFMAVEGPGANQSVGAVAGILSAIDPFRIWFWLMVAVGLTTTAQLPGWKAWATCISFWLFAAGVRTLAVMSAAGGPPSA